MKTNVSFDCNRFRLIGTNITASDFTAGPTVGNNNRLYFPAGTVSAPGGTNNNLTVQYYFLALVTGTSSTIFPFSDLKSGGQEKYTGNFGTCTNTPCDQTLPAPSDPFAISKSVSPSSLPTGGTATYTVTVTNTSAFDASVDSITDVLPSGATYQGLAAGSDVTSSNSASVPLSALPARSLGRPSWVRLRRHRTAIIM